LFFLSVDTSQGIVNKRETESASLSQKSNVYSIKQSNP